MATEFSCGWVFHGANATAVKAQLNEHGIKAFVGPDHPRHVCVFPARESLGGDKPVAGQRPREAELTEALDDATLVSVVVTEFQTSQSMAVMVWKNGHCKANLKLPMFATQAARARAAEEDLRSLVTALESKADVPTIEVNQPIKLRLLRILGLELQEFAFIGFDGLFDERLKPGAQEKWAGYQYVNELGQEEPFQLARDAVTAPGPTSASELVDFRKCRTARQWLDLRKLVDPRTANDHVMEHLRLVLLNGLNLEGTPDQLVVVREQAAMLLGRCLAAKRGKAAKDEIGGYITKTSSKGVKALWKVALAGAEAQLKPRPATA